MDKEQARLAQGYEVMFERNLALIASKRQEVRIFSDGFVYEGFLGGLDDSWVQLYGHEENDKNNADTQWRFILLNKNNISSIGPTGRGLHDYDNYTREFISKKIQTFSSVCDKFLVSKGVKNDGRREKI